MSKVICDICGTSYPETSNQCPICGCVRPAEAVVADEVQQEEGGYTYVKGGRFSKSNVKKRNMGIAPQMVSTKAPGKAAGQAPAKEKKPVNKKIIGFIIVFGCLLLILSVLALILWGQTKKDDTPKNDIVENVDVSCTGIKLSVRTFEITSADASLNLSVTTTPSNTTDKVTYTSSNPDVVTVDDKGNITFVSNGKADILVQCGSIKDTCTITCNVPEEPTEPEPTEEPTQPPVEIRFLTTLIQTTEYFQCEPNTSYTLYVGQVPVTEIRWYSENPDVAEFRDGVVYMKANGTTTVYAEYGEQKLSCTVIVGPGTDYNLLSPDTDIDLADYTGWCKYGASWTLNIGDTWVNVDGKMYENCIDVSINNETYNFGLYELETEAAIILAWRPVYSHESVVYDEDTKVFSRNNDVERGEALYYAEHGDETIYLCIR